MTSRSWVVIGALWVIVTAVALEMRPVLPVDETRYLAVAWDMWLEGNYLVPHLHGEPYSHKPPLLFWLMTMGWHAFGVNEWWPRLVAPLFGLAALLLTARLGRGLWPEYRMLPGLASVLLFGALFWTVFGTLTMFDMLLAVFTLIALIGAVEALRHGGYKGFLLMGVAMGFGALAKGPAILLHVLPVALTAPWWRAQLTGAGIPSNTRWYLGVVCSVMLAFAIGLAWAVPAGIAGGEEYRNAIIWGQSADRMVKSFAHARPFWWYAAVLPVLILPWLVWPKLWRAVRWAGDVRNDGGIRFCLIWFGVAFVAFSLISGKQLHYLLPEFPALALVAARLLAGQNTMEQSRAIDRWLPGGFAVVLGVMVSLAERLPLSARAQELVSEARPEAGLLIAVAGLIALLVRGADIRFQAVRLAAISAFSVLALHLVAAPYLERRYELSEMAAYIAKIQASGTKVAYFGKYHGQFHFLGRLKEPLVMIGLQNGQEERFLKRYPDGVIVAKYRNVPTVATPLFTAPYRRFTYAVWPASVMRAHPSIGERR